MRDARGPGWVRGCRTGPDPCQRGGLPGPPPGKGTWPRWALGALDVSPLVCHLCSGDQAMRFRKNPFLPARLPVTAPAEASKRLGPAPAPWDSHGGRRRLSEGCAVFEDGWLSPCALRGHPPSPRRPSPSPPQTTQRCPRPVSRPCSAVWDPRPRRHSGLGAPGCCGLCTCHGVTAASVWTKDRHAPLSRMSLGLEAERRAAHMPPADAQGCDEP